MRCRIVVFILMIVLCAPGISYSQASRKDELHINLTMVNENIVNYRNNLAKNMTNFIDLRSSISKTDVSAYMLIKYELLLTISYTDLFQCRCSTAMWQLKSAEDVHLNDILNGYNTSLNKYRNKLTEGLKNAGLFSRYISNQSAMEEINKYKDLLNNILSKVDSYIEENKNI